MSKLVLYEQAAKPPVPNAGAIHLYAKDDHQLYYQIDDDTEFPVGNVFQGDDITAGILTADSGLFDAGSVGTPAVQFGGDTTSGLYRPSANKLGISLSGVQKALFESTGLLITQASNKVVDIREPAASSGQIPAGATNLGAGLGLSRATDGTIAGSIYMVNNNDLGYAAILTHRWAVNGTEVGSWDASTLSVVGTIASTTDGLITTSDGTVTGKMQSRQANSALEVGSTSAHKLNLWANGAVRLSLATSGQADFSSTVFTINTGGYYFGDNSTFTGMSGSNATPQLDFYVGNAIRASINNVGIIAKALTVDDGSGSIMAYIGGTSSSAQGAGLRFRTGTGKYAWQIAAQQNLDNVFEITPSDATGGNVYSTPLFKLTQAGVLTGPSRASIPIFDTDVAILGSTNASAGYQIRPQTAADGLKIMNYGASADSATISSTLAYFASKVQIGTPTAISAGYGLEVTNTGAGKLAAIFKSSDGATNGTFDVWNAATSGDNLFISFLTEAGASSRGNIDFNRGATQVRYNVTSDQRIKTDLGPMEEIGEKLDLIQLHKYMVKETNYITHGPFAQELYSLFPDVVGVGDEEKLWSVNPGGMIWPIVKELQSLRKRVAQLETIH